MMGVQIAAVGRLRPGAERELLSAYLDRAQACGRRLGFGPFSVLEVPEAKLRSAEGRKSAEAAALLAKIPGDVRLIALDRTGVSIASETFAENLRGFREQALPGICFAIGGADGLGAAVLERAGETLSLGPMVLPHGLARIVLAEQLYRAMTVLAGHPYHRG